MKKLTKLISLLLALSMLFALAACGDTVDDSNADDNTPAATDNNTPDTPDEPEDTGVQLGAYTFEMVSIYGDTIDLTVILKDGGGVTIMGSYADGSNATYSAAWTDNGDGTFTTSDIDPELDGANFVADDGTVKWIVDGTAVTPDGYVAPTEFVEKEGAVKDPATNAEAVGVYVAGQTNKFGSVVPYVLWLNADGTVQVHMNNSFTGLRTYTGDEWYMNGDGTLHIGALAADEGTPFGDWFNADDGYSSDWHIYGNGTACPVGFEESAGTVEVSELPAEIYPANAQTVGVYVAGQANKFGSVVPYVLWLNADGTVQVHMNNSFTGLRTYTGDEWYLNEDGTLHIGALAAAEGTPFGDWFNADDNYSSDWTVYDNGTACPVGFEESNGTVDVSELPAEIYPA